MMRTMRIPMFRRATQALLLNATCAGVAYAQLNVEISNVGASQYPIAVANFQGEAQASQNLPAIIRADLARSDRFSNVDVAGAAVLKSLVSDPGAQKTKGVAAFVGGTVTRNGDRYEIRFRLYDTAKGESLSGLSLTHGPGQLCLVAHEIADYIYQKLIDGRGVFATRPLYVSKVGRRFQLQISDSNGVNPQIALASNEPIISLSWSPDGTKVVYVSFEGKKPVVCMHDLVAGHRTVISNQKGNNPAPVWSPDGRHVAVSLSRDNNTQVYLVNANGPSLHRLNRNSVIDIEPSLSPDGRYIYFTSDRGGAPQIHHMSVDGEEAGAAQRVTFKGNYNTSPCVSSDGKLLAYISRAGGAFRLYTQDLSNGDVNALTDTSNDESPSFAASGKFILYVIHVGGKPMLVTVSTDDRMRQVLSLQAGEVREPAWGPFMQ